MASNRQARFPRWAVGVIGAVTLLAAAILVLAVVLGVRAGQSQYELRSRQQVGISLQQALDFRSEGRLTEALRQYQNVLTLDPTNAAAQEGMQALLAMAQGADAAAAASGIPPTLDPAATPAAASDSASVPAAAATTAVAPAVAAAPVPTGVSSTDGVLRPAVAFPTPQTPVAGSSDPLAAVPVVGAVAPPLAVATSALAPAELEARAQAAYRAGRWQEAVELLIQWQMVAPATQRTLVDQELFDAYLNLATEKDNEENLTAALTLYDRALLLQPNDTAVRAERDLISAYLEVLATPETNTTQSAELLSTLYALEPDYRDVRERLQVALVRDGDRLIAAGDWCAAAERYSTLAEVTTLPDLLLRRDQVQTACDTGQAPASLAAAAPGTTVGAGTALAAATPAAPASSAAASSGAALGGRLLYSVRDPVSGVTNVLVQPASGAPSSVLVENGAQPALRDDGTRLAYRNLRTDQGGISAFDPATGVFFRITDYAEDVLPSWDPQGTRVVFASNREGDRRWRIYTAWAEEAGVVATLSYGEAPAWHPASDLIIHRGCDDSGNACGLWLMDGGGGNRRSLTSVAGDTRPAWSPDGRVVVFMSDGRDGNPEIYRVDTATGQVVQLTQSAGIETLPAVSPDGQWVAYISNADDAWKILAVPLAGGTPRVVAPLKGDLGDWHTQALQWVN